MKTILAVMIAQLLFASAASAVTWAVVSVSVVVNKGGDQLQQTVLTTRSYVNFVATKFATSRDDLFVGFREDSGVIAVVRRSDETVLYNIVSGLGTGGTATNGINSKGVTSVTATVSSLNTDFPGFIYDTFKRKSDGSLQAVTRQFLGGSGNQTLKGTAQTTGRKIEL